MAHPFAVAQVEVAELVKQFKTNLALYRAPTYKEASARQEFIDKMFVYLGWDVYNEEHAAPQYRDVEVEPTQDVEGEKKAPDYVFRIGKEKKFFVEAKKPGVSIKTDIKPAYQIRRYAWSAKLPLSLLTDFEELAVYDCRTRPSITDQAGVARINFFTFDQYPDRWREIWDVFSREAVRGGSFDQYSDQAKGKRGTATVDAEFLKEIEGWRETLARNIAIRNPKLSIDELNDAVQRTIDRIIFLRMTEDRGIEAQDRLLALTGRPRPPEQSGAGGGGEGENIYAGLLHLFQQADAKYNSGLFDFNADRLTAKLSIDDKVLKPIIADLYYPQPYEFSVMPAEILGNVYEQFLGKVIRLTAAHQAKVEEKPEVKKAGGVYYTPAYIVDYIVQHTVGQMIEGKTPRQLQSFRALDMACGSGSFLLGAYQYLLDYYLKWYIDHLDPSGLGNPKGLVRIGDDWRLTTAERKRILLTHIFGVDIDRQAVEVTKLSLLLKVLEGENEQSLQMELIVKERALPNLDANIKCGNSLIGPDYFDDRPLGFFETPKVLDDEHRRVNPFDWQTEFPDAMKAGGFDCIIGNPPYVRQESLSESKTYMSQHYHSYHSMADLYVYFIERGLSLLKPNGLFSIIVSSSFLRVTYAAPLRHHLRTAGGVISLVDFGGLSLFENAKDVYVCIPVLGKQSQPDIVTVCQADSFKKNNLDQYAAENQYAVPASQFTDEAWSIVDEQITITFTKIASCGVPLGKYIQGRIFYGLKTGLNEAFEVDAGLCSEMLKSAPRCQELIKPFVGGQDIRRYFIRDTQRFLIVIPAGWTLRQMKKSKASESEAWAWLNKTYKPIAQHLAEYEAPAKRRQDQGNFWWELRACDYYDALEGRKIIYPDIAKNPRFYFDTDGIYIGNTAYCLASDDLYLLGLLNSRLAWFAISRISIPFGIRAGEYRYRLIYQYMEKFPIRPIDFTKPQDKARHDRMVSLVEKMLALHQQLPSAKTAADRDLIQRQIDATDRSIDALVYELYGLTDEEIKIVEGA